MRLGQCLLVGLLVLAAGLAGANWRATQPATASAPPQALFYSGVLVKDGAPVADGSYPVTLTFFDKATGGTAIPCSTDPIAASFVQGRFRVPLDPTCVAGVVANPAVFVQVLVTGTPDGDVTIPKAGGARPQVGSVPFALTATTASVTDALCAGCTNNVGAQTLLNVSVPLCTTTMCTIDHQSNALVTSVQRDQAGVYKVHLAPGAFSAPPTCVATAMFDDNALATINDATTVDVVPVVMLSSANPSIGRDHGFAVICMGPK